MAQSVLFAMTLQAIIMFMPSSSQSDFCISGRLGFNYAINGFYKYEGIWNNYPYYKRDIEEGSGVSNTLYIFWSESSNQLKIHSSLDETDSCCYARCTLSAHEPSECDNAWKVWDGTASTLDINVYTIPDSCPSFCIWGRVGYNKPINGLYTYQGIWNNHPYYKKDNGGEFCTILYIFWSKSNTQLLIHSSLDDEGDCCYARCTLFGAAHDPSECDNAWKIWDGTSWTLDSEVFSVTDGCPSWQCDEVSVTSICKGGACTDCEGPFDEHIGPNIWKNKPNKYWYFAPFDYRWVCGEYPPDCKNTYIETATAQGWTDLDGGSINLDFILPDVKSYTVNCINYPTGNPTTQPTPLPTINPSSHPTNIPTAAPTNNPTTSPTLIPTSAPSINPSSSPTNIPTYVPTSSPTNKPSSFPTAAPTYYPTSSPISLTNHPTTSPSFVPTINPNSSSTSEPTMIPTLEPTNIPSSVPTKNAIVPNPTILSTNIAVTANPTSNPLKKTKTTTAIKSTTFKSTTLQESTVITLYTVSIKIKCDDNEQNKNNECDVDTKQLKQHILIALSGDIELLSTEIINEEIVIKLSVTTDIDHVLQTDVMRDDIETELNNDINFGDVEVEVQQTNKTKTASESILDYLNILYLLLSIAVVVICIIYGVCAFKKRRFKMAEKEIIAEMVKVQHIIEVNPVQDWIVNTFDLRQYIELFINNGYDEMNLVMIMNERDLKEIGIDNKEHRMMIMAEIEKMKEAPGVNGEINEMEIETENRTIEGEIGTYNNSKPVMNDNGNKWEIETNVNVNNISVPKRTKQEVVTDGNIQDDEFVINGDD